MIIQPLENTKTWLIRNEGEWARFSVDYVYITSEDGGGRHSCLFNGISSYGAFGFFWSHMGMDWIDFLNKVSADYFLNKVWEDAFEMDEAAFTEQVERTLAEMVEDESISSFDAEDLRWMLGDGFTHDTMEELHRHNIIDPMDGTPQRIKCGYQRFFDILFKPWIAAMAEERAVA